MKKIDKEFCLTDNSVNCYGYRLLTQGLELEKFTPPIGYLMHQRDKGVAVKWVDFRLEADKLYAKPVVNTALFSDLAGQIENGFYAAASVGNIVALQTDDSPELKLQGQTGPTVTHWFPRECSIVDIPGNYNALAKLYDKNNSVLCDLSFTHNKINNMYSNEFLQLLDLKGHASESAVIQQMHNLKMQAEKGAQYKQELENLKASLTLDKVESLLNQAVEAGKIMPLVAENLKANYAHNPEGLEDLLSNLSAQKKITQTLTDTPTRYVGKTFNDLFVSGELETLKQEYPALYEQLKSNPTRKIK